MSGDKDSNSKSKSLEEMVETLDQEFYHKLEKLKKEVEDDLKFSHLDKEGMEMEIINTISKQQRWAGRLASEKNTLKRLEDYLKRTYANIWQYYRYERSDLALTSKSDIEQMIIRFPKYVKCEVILEQQKSVVEFLEQSLHSFRNKNFALKNIIENRKYFDGN
jgi:hypothetical protein